MQAVQNSSDGSQDRTASNSILLMPPPLVLVHGIWSDATAWYPFESWVETNYPDQFVSAADYGATRNLSFNNPGTQQVLSTTIANALASAAQSGVAARKVDVLAHSMGGLVTRYFMSNGAPAPFSSAYLPPNPIHDLITVGTPHDGSQLAALLDSNFNATTTDPIISADCIANGLIGSACNLSSFMALQGKQVGTGTSSLEPTSNAIQSLTDTNDYQSIVGGAPVAVSGESYGSPTEGVLNWIISSFVPGQTVDNVLGSANDTIVSATSQLGVPSSYGTVSVVVHAAIVPTDTGETASSAVWNQAVHWLLGNGTGQAPSNSEVRKNASTPHQGLKALDASSTTPDPVFDLAGYTQISASNVNFFPHWARHSPSGQRRRLPLLLPLRRSPKFSSIRPSQFLLTRPFFINADTI